MTYNKKNGRLSDMFTLFVDTVLVLYKNLDIFVSQLINRPM